jgi:hypothetical protein
MLMSHYGGMMTRSKADATLTACAIWREPSGRLVAVSLEREAPRDLIPPQLDTGWTFVGALPRGTPLEDLGDQYETPDGDPIRCRLAGAEVHCAWSVLHHG